MPASISGSAGRPPGSSEADPRPSGEELFAAQARTAGLVVPRRRGADPWLAAVVTAFIVGGAMWAGLLTHNFTPAPREETCATPAVTLYGALDAGVDQSVAGDYHAFAAEYLNSLARCYAVILNASSGTDALAPLAKGSSQFVVVGSSPSQVELRALAAPIVVLPLTVGSLDIVFHLPGPLTELNLTSQDVAAICLGTIRNWSAPLLEATNPGLVGQPERPLLTAYLSGATSATQDLTSYLSETNATWRTSFGEVASVGWSHTVLVNNTTAMLGFLSQNPGSIGFVPDDSVASLQSLGLGVAALGNTAGNFALPNATGLAAAATWAATHPSGSPAPDEPDLQTANASSTWSYPLTAFSYAVMFQNVTQGYAGKLSPNGAWHLLQFFQWVLQLGQAENGSAELPPPTALAEVTESGLYQVTYHGESLMLGPPDSESGEGGGGNDTGEF